MCIHIITFITSCPALATSLCASVEEGVDKQQWQTHFSYHITVICPPGGDGSNLCIKTSANNKVYTFWEGERLSRIF